MPTTHPLGKGGDFILTELLLALAIVKIPFDYIPELKRGGGSEAPLTRGRGQGWGLSLEQTESRPIPLWMFVGHIT